MRGSSQDESAIRAIKIRAYFQGSFQASLVTSASLATQFTLPAVGQYTIGVFRSRLVEPAKVEPTVFQLKGCGNTTTD